MKVSVITPTYNDSKYIKGCIESVESQKYGDVEHIVVDGGSTDDTVELLRAHRHIKWISEPDEGMYDAVNKGIGMASGEIVSYLNSDDRYYEYTLELVSDTFHKNPDLDFVYGQCTVIDEREEPKYTLRPVPYIPSVLRGGRITWCQPACFWRKHVHDRIGFFDTSFKNTGDWDFFHRMLTDSLKGGYIRKPLAQFMLRKDCISKTMAENRAKELEIVARKYALSRRKWSYMINETVFTMLNIHTYYSRLLYKLYSP